MNSSARVLTISVARLGEGKVKLTWTSFVSLTGLTSIPCSRTLAIRLYGLAGACGLAVSGPGFFFGGKPFEGQKIFESGKQARFGRLAAPKSGRLVRFSFLATRSARDLLLISRSCVL